MKSPTLMLSFLFLLTLSPRAQAGLCRVAQNSGPSKRGSVLDLVPQWQAEVMKSLAPCKHECVVWPKSMDFSFSSQEKYQITVAAQRLRYSVMRAVPRLATEAGDIAQQGIRTNLENLLNDAQLIIRQEQPVSEASRQETERGVKLLGSYWDRIRGNLRFNDFQVAPLVDSANHYLSRIHELRAIYGIDLVSDEVMIGAGFGNLASRVILDTMGQSRETTKALDAISLLHPLTDNALDHGLDVGGSMQKITDSIMGKARDKSTETKFDSLVLDLLDDVFTEFPREKHPLITHLLMDLHRAQMDSAKVQRNKESTRDEILEVVLRKGGYTGLLMAYLSKGKLSESEAKLFYEAGGLFQLGDDLLDVREDLRDGTRTLWTMGLKSKEGFKQTFQTFLKLQDHLEKTVPNMEAGADLKQSLQNDVEAGFKFYLISAYLNPALSSHIGKYLSDKIPISPGNLKSILFQSFRNLTSIEGTDARLMAAMKLYGRVFDHHFLGGQFAKWNNRRIGGLRPYIVSHWNPFFVAVKFETMVAERIRKIGASAATATVIALGIVQLMTFDYLAYHTDIGQGTYTMLGVGMGLSAIEVYRNIHNIEKMRPWGWLWFGTLLYTTGLATASFF